jgi:cystathionine gamma-synthase
MKDWRKVRLETLAVHAGHEIDAATGAVAAPIHLSTTFERDVDGTYSRGFMYTRNDNPNRKALEKGVSALEGGSAAAAFGSGMAAAMGLLGALAPGDHVLAHVDAYYGTSRLLRDLFLRWKLEADFTDMSDLPAVKKALRPNTKLVWMETPSNPLLKIVDLAAVAKISIPLPNISAAIVMCSAESLSRNATTNFFTVFARFNIPAARSPRPSIAG